MPAGDLAVKLLLPHADGVKEMLPGGRFGEVELDQVEVPVPGSVTEGVAIWGELVEAQVGKPVFVRGVLPICLHVAKRPEIAPHVVENAIKHQVHPARVERIGKLCQVGAGAKAAVDVEVIGSVVAVAAGLKNRTKVEGIGSQTLNVVQPAQDLPQARLGLGLKVVERGRGASPQGINVVKNAVLIDSSHISSELYQTV